MDTYIRQTFRERGYFSNHFTLLPVRKLIFDNYHLEVQLGGNNYRFPYSELKAEIHMGYMSKSYGVGAVARIKQTMVWVFSKELKFGFDLSGQFPDFKNRKELLALIIKKLETTEVIKETLKEHKSADTRILVFLSVILALLIGGGILFKNGI